MLQDQIKATACAGEMRLLYGRVEKKKKKLKRACLLQKSKPLKPSKMMRIQGALNKRFFPQIVLHVIPLKTHPVSASSREIRKGGN